MNEKLLNYILLGVKFLVGGIGLILCLMIMSGETETPDGEKLHNTTAINGGLILSYIVFGGCLLIWLGFGLWNIISDIKKSIPLLISVAVFGLVVFIAYSLASEELLETWKKKPDMFTPGNLRWSDVGLFTMYIMILTTILVIVYNEISKFFK